MLRFLLCGLDKDLKKKKKGFGFGLNQRKICLIALWKKHAKQQMTRLIRHKIQRDLAKVMFMFANNLTKIHTVQPLSHTLQV
jgi:hypothetical protein